MTSSAKRPQWFALKVHACCEKQVEDLLRKHLYISTEKVEVDTFLPIQKVYKNEATGEFEYNRPVADGIVFARFVPNYRVFDAIRNTLPYVYNFYLTAETKQPEPIPDDQINRFRQMLNDSPFKVELVNRLHKGDRIKIIRGKLAGLTGILEKDDTGCGRIYVELKILGKYARTRINKAETMLCDSFDNESASTRIIKSPKFKALANSFKLHYDKISSTYLRTLANEDLCNLVRFHNVLLRAESTLPALKTIIWEKDPYCYQHFFADVYREIAERTKATRKKDERAPLLHALHGLCNQVSERAYTIKTNKKWVDESIASISSWFVKYRPSGDNLDYVQLLMDCEQDEQSIATISEYTDKWFAELSEANTALPSADYIRRLQIISAFAATGRSRIPIKAVRAVADTLREKLKDTYTMPSVIMLCEALGLIHSKKAAKSNVFSELQDIIDNKPPSVMQFCAKAMCELYQMELKLQHS